MKRYIFVSDIHGCFDKLILALNKVKFNKNKDILVSVGDAFDRGPDNKKVLDYLLKLPNKILIWGNHDFRLYDLIIKNKDYSWVDKSNGTVSTIIELGENINPYDAKFTLVNKKNKNAELLRSYFDQCVYAIEFKNLIATHAWVPYNYYVNNSLANIDERDWVDATWTNTENWVSTIDEISKPLLVGHFHAFRIAEDCFNEKRNKDDFDKVNTSIFISPDKKLICIDGCTNIDRGQVITYILETNEEPIIYKKEDND